MVQIPDNVRPYFEAVVKHHFWILLTLVPVVVLPMVFLARGKLAAEITAAQGQIDSRLSAVKSVAGIQPHPNEAWSGEIDKATRRVKRETLAEWQRFWDSQKPLRVWPTSLGADFVQRVTVLKPAAKLPRPLLERYRDGVGAIVRTLPARMGADEMMLEGGAAGPGQPGGAMPPGGLRQPAGMQPGMPEPGMMRGRPGAPEKPAAIVQWNPADQQRLYASFDWDKPPSTMQMVLAQEELWVYGVLIDVIARANKASAGAYNAAIPFVEQIAVGYPAAEENPGAAGGRRILVPAAAGQAGGMGEFGRSPDQAMMEGGAAGGAAARPPHPRFAARVGAGVPMMGPAGEAPAADAGSPDDLLRSWIYVDFSGKPLMGAELATSPDAQLVHLMPFVIRAVVDERKIDALLVDLATASVPIDVRQVRINAATAGPGAGMAAMGSGGGFGAGFDEAGGRAAAPGSRPHDVTLELRGTVALATQPDPQVVGLEAERADENEAAAPDDAKPDDAKPDDAKPDDAKPDDAKPDDAKPDDAKPDDAKPDDAKPDDAKPDDAKPDDAKPAKEPEPVAANGGGNQQ